MDLRKISQLLKKARQEKKLTVKDASQITKLAPLVIRKIEEAENLESMGSFYLKGFLKIYAKALGEKELVEEIERYFQEKKLKPKKLFKKESLKQPSARFPEFKIQWILKRPLLKTSILLLIGLLLATILYIPLRSKSKRFTIKKKQEIKVEEKKQSAGLLPKIKPFITILTKEKVFIEVKVDSNLVFQGVLLAGNKETWQAKKKIEIKISNPSLVSLEIGGQIVPTSNIRKPTLYIVQPQEFRVKKLK